MTATPGGISSHTTTERESTGAHLLVGEGGAGGEEAGGVRESEPVVEGGSSHPVDREAGSHPMLPVTSPYMAQQLPPLTKFTGETIDEGETFAEWLEQLEMVATACHWDEPAKLVNLVTRLKGQAFSFYRSCDATQRNQDATLVMELKKCFTPIHIQSLQSSLFHDRRQRVDESVDTYAQELKRLFHRAYPKAQQGHSETESMGKSVLAYQFIAGLQPRLKTKLAGNEGEFEQLLVRARFEEAKNRDYKHLTRRKYLPRRQLE